MEKNESMNTTKNLPWPIRGQGQKLSYHYSGEYIKHVTTLQMHKLSRQTHEARE